MNATAIQSQFVAVMAKHLPPSSSRVNLLDLDGTSGELLAQWRADLDIRHIAPPGLNNADIAGDTVDAIVGYDIDIDTALLGTALNALRPGGRFIAVLSLATVKQSYPQLLKDHGYVRILVEPALDELGVLLRGEKPHLTANTAQRIRSVAREDADSLGLSGFRGRYLHLLIQQKPNKPVWKLEQNEQIRWQAAAIQQQQKPTLLAFSSLPKAVAFLQSAVLANNIRDINKVGKFSLSTAKTWEWDIVINPPPEFIRDRALTYLEIDPTLAEAPDE